MQYVIVKYKVKAGRADESVAYIKAVFNEPDEVTPDHIRYASFQQDDKRSFVHIGFDIASHHFSISDLRDGAV